MAAKTLVASREDMGVEKQKKRIPEYESYC